MAELYLTLIPIFFHRPSGHKIFNMTKKRKEAIDLLVGLHKREIDGAEHERKQRLFDEHVADYKKVVGVESLTEEELRELADAAIEYKYVY